MITFAAERSAVSPPQPFCTKRDRHPPDKPGDDDQME